MTDIEPGLIRQWQTSRRKSEQAAARLATELRGRQRWEAVDDSRHIAARLDVSETTIRRAKALLAAHGAITKDSIRHRPGYYVT